MKAILLCALITLFHFGLIAQVTNGSFETDPQTPSTSGWTNICPGLGSEGDAPDGGGNWCLQLTSGNTQSCYPGLALQEVTWMQAGEYWLLSTWARVDSSFAPFSGASIALAIQHPGDSFTVLGSDTTYKTWWDSLHCVVQIPQVDTPDKLMIVLNAGLTGGPFQGYAYFDLVETSITTPLSSKDILHNSEDRLYIHYDAISGQCILNKPLSSNADFSIFDLNGRMIQNRNCSEGQTIVKVNDLNSGIFIYRIQDEKVIHSGKILVSH